MTKLTDEQLTEIRSEKYNADWFSIGNLLDTITDLQAQLATKKQSYDAMSASEFDLRRELSASREMGPCGKHTKMFSKRVMRLPKNASYPNFVETHYEDDWCVKSRCEPVYVCGCSGIHREDQPAHSNQLMVTCTLCVEIQAERAAVLEQAIGVIEEFDNLLISNFEEAKWFDVKGKMRALISTTDRSALDRIIEEKVREGRLAEAEWWFTRVAMASMDMDPRDECKERITPLRAVPAEDKQ